MSVQMWIRSHVELLLARELGVCRIEPDEDGDYPVPADTSLCWVSLLEGDRTMIRVNAHAAYDLRPGLKLLRELNDIQARCLSASVRLAGDVVVVTQTLSPEGLTQPVLGQALSAVRSVADDIGPLLALMYDGVTPVQAGGQQRGAEAAP